MTLEENVEKVYPKILKFVAYSPRTKKETSDRLKKYLGSTSLSSSDKDLIFETLISRLEDEKLIDDVKYSGNFVHSIINSTKPRGSQYISRFLYKKGVPENIIEIAISKIDQDEEFKQGLMAAQKKLKFLKVTEGHFKTKQKLWSYLSARGFSSNVIGRVIDRVLGVN